jgi:glyoxylase-like metal-dependent hydrolase (beta-lactamase superfamily II)
MRVTTGASRRQHVITVLGLCLTAASLHWLTPAILYGQGPQGPPPGGPAASPGFDLSGYWTPVLHEDSMDRGAGPEIADYGGLPLNEAGRLFALSYDPSRLTLRHHQCDGYVAPYQSRALGNARAWEERDPHTHRLIAIHWFSQTFEGKRTIWMDGRAHPPAWAPHTWMGFSTGRFVGSALEVRTTHLKQGWLRRNGAPESDQATLVEFYVRHADHLTYTVVVNDPVFLEEPLVVTSDFARAPVDPQNWLFPCDDGEQVRDRAPDDVPSFLFGGNPFVKEYRDRNKLPGGSHLGGAASMYPEVAAVVNGAYDSSFERPAPGVSVVSKAVSPEPTDGTVHVWRVRDNVYLLTGDGGNIVVQVGTEGAFVVDTGTGRLAEKTLAAIRTLTDKPVQFIVNTSFHADRTGGNAALGTAGSDPSVRGTFFALQFRDAGVGATMMAHQNVQNRLVAAGAPARAVPSDTYLEERRRTFHNDDAIEMFWQPNAVTDGDSLVHFRRADVIVTGNVFTTTRFPLIDVGNGGTVEGVIKALNVILDKTVFAHQGQGGTIVIPGHGYVSDEHEVVEYRDMLVIIRDRIRAMKSAGATLPQVLASRPTADYDTRYGAVTGPWTTTAFVDAVYRSVPAPGGR